MGKRGPKPRTDVVTSLWKTHPFYSLPTSLKRGEIFSGMVHYPPPKEGCTRVVFWLECTKSKGFGVWKKGLSILKPEPGFSGARAVFVLPKELPPGYTKAKFYATAFFHGKRGPTKVTREIPIEE